MNYVFELISALTERYAGRTCRRCAEPISPRDAFGLSEAVCAGCRA